MDADYKPFDDTLFSSISEKINEKKEVLLKRENELDKELQEVEKENREIEMDQIKKELRNISSTQLQPQTQNGGSHLKGYEELNEETKNKVQNYIAIAIDSGIIAALDRVVKENDSHLLDVFHDLLAEKVHARMKENNLL